MRSRLLSNAGRIATKKRGQGGGGGAAPLEKAVVLANSTGTGIRSSSSSSSKKSLLPRLVPFAERKTLSSAAGTCSSNPSAAFHPASIPSGHLRNEGGGSILHRNRRHFSTGSGAATGGGSSSVSGDLGLARGRRRFYLDVGFEACDGPETAAPGGAVRNLLAPRTPSPSLAAADDETGGGEGGAGDKMSKKGGAEEPSWYSVTLDGRSLRTPRGALLKVPSRVLAAAVAAEWDAVRGEIRPTQMPFTTLCCTSLDLAMSGTEGDVERYRESCLRYLHNDTLAYWADGAVERPLRQRQERLWKPILDAFEEEWGHRIAVVEHDVAGGGSMIMRGSRSGGNGGGTGGLRLDHPEELRVACTRWVDEELDAWHLVALYSLAAEAKSFVLAWALLAGRLGLEDKAPVEACRVEEEFQISNWGMVEGGHDYDRLNCSIQLHAAVLLKDFIAFELGAPGLGSEQQRKA